MSYAASFYFDIFVVLPWGMVKRGPRDGQLKPDNWMDAWMFERLSQIVVKLQECLKDIKTWMATNVTVSRMSRVEKNEGGSKCRHAWRRFIVNIKHK